MHSHWRDFVYFFIGVIIPTYNLFSWVSSTFGKGLRKLFIRTERQAIVFAHAKLHAAKRGHAPKSPVECDDDRCAEV